MLRFSSTSITYNLYTMLQLETRLYILVEELSTGGANKMEVEIDGTLPIINSWFVRF